ncbi:hypothetical protein GCM10023091_12920 [Ravibacter arvi]|uniref:Tetratricopeptide repeat protein n=1 Tax=Ravibacter arvi TaxID=2051041 RepID=A0ABP8LU13_9BACT
MDKRIEAFLNNELSEQELQLLEEQLKADKSLAEELAFYLSVKKLAARSPREDRLQDRHREWTQMPKNGQARPLGKWIASVAAAIIVLIGVVWLLNTNRGTDLRVESSRYMADHFQTLSVQMSAEQDSLQMAISAYNADRPAETLAICEHILAGQPGHSEAQRIGGLAALRLKDYDKAIRLFTELGDNTSLFGNPGRFYEAIARLQEGSEANRKQAELRLHEVIDQDLEGKKEVQKWLNQP